MIRNCRYTGQGFDSPRLHHSFGVVVQWENTCFASKGSSVQIRSTPLRGRTWNSTGMTMVESRLHGVATTQKLQNSNWKLQSITHGCLVSKPEFGQYLSTETAHFLSYPKSYSNPSDMIKVCHTTDEIQLCGTTCGMWK